MAEITSQPKKVGPKQRTLDRLRFIEFRALFLGVVSRSDLATALGISPAVATREIAAYQEYSGNQLELDQLDKKYRPKADFQPSFEHAIDQTLVALTLGYKTGGHEGSNALIPSEVASPLCLPSWQVLAPISRAIHHEQAATLIYHSYNSGKKQREIIPHALAYNGSRWHVRAYDRQRKTFIDFVLTRVERAEELPESSVHPHEHASSDNQWTRIVELELVPHPQIDRPKITSMDFGMKDGVLKVRHRAALVGYLLHQWNVDCSNDHHLKQPDKNIGHNIRLWLRNPLALFDVESALMAPGYSPPAQPTST